MGHGHRAVIKGPINWKAVYRNAMKVLVVGSGGREHALSWKLGRSASVEQVYCVPGNAGVAAEFSCLPADVTSNAEVASLAESLGVDLTVIGPEAPLAAGIVDEFRSRHLPIVGPTSASAQLEGSKVFAKEFMQRHGIPTADSALIESEFDLDAALSRFGYPVALKADGLAAGKGVVIVKDEAEARRTAASLLSGELVGGAGRRFLVEQFLTGEEVSFIVLSDGSGFYDFPPTQDHKPADDNDKGPNTGGMGAYCDPAILRADVRDTVIRTIVEPTLNGLRETGTPFTGFLYCGLMMTAEGPKVLEYNVRLGDPETQPLMYRMTGDLGELLLSAAQGELNTAPVAWSEGPTVCVVLASQGYPGDYPRGRPISGIPAAEKNGAKVFHAGTRFHQGKIATAGGRVLGVTAGGIDLETAIANTYAAVKEIQFEGAHYRSDIGQRGLHRAH